MHGANAEMLTKKGETASDLEAKISKNFEKKLEKDDLSKWLMNNKK